MTQLSMTQDEGIDCLYTMDQVHQATFSRLDLLQYHGQWPGHFRRFSLLLLPILENSLPTCDDPPIPVCPGRPSMVGLAVLL